MALPLNVDWNLIQTLYAQGLRPKEISAKTGVKADSISARASRKGWTKLALDTKLIMQEARPNHKSVTHVSEDRLAQRSMRARERLASTLERLADKVEEIPILTGSRAMTIAQDLEPLVRSCKTVFGWSDSTGTPAVRIDHLNSITVQQSPPIQSTTVQSDQVIDCHVLPSDPKA